MSSDMLVEKAGFESVFGMKLVKRLEELVVMQQ